jgi:hypothetical protein
VEVAARRAGEGPARRQDASQSGGQRPDQGIELDPGEAAFVSPMLVSRESARERASQSLCVGSGYRRGRPVATVEGGQQHVSRSDLWVPEAVRVSQGILGDHTGESTPAAKLSGTCRQPISR